jgi:hypothetical protein
MYNYYNIYIKYQKKYINLYKQNGGSGSDEEEEFNPINFNAEEYNRSKLIEIARQYGIENPETYSNVRLMVAIREGKKKSSNIDELPMSRYRGMVLEKEELYSDSSKSEEPIPLTAIHSDSSKSEEPIPLTAIQKPLGRRPPGLSPRERQQFDEMVKKYLKINDKIDLWDELEIQKTQEIIDGDEFSEFQTFKFTWKENNSDKNYIMYVLGENKVPFINLLIECEDARIDCIFNVNGIKMMGVGFNPKNTGSGEYSINQKKYTEWIVNKIENIHEIDGYDSIVQSKLLVFHKRGLWKDISNKYNFWQDIKATKILFDEDKNSDFQTYKYIFDHDGKRVMYFLLGDKISGLAEIGIININDPIKRYMFNNLLEHYYTKRDMETLYSTENLIRINKYRKYIIDKIKKIYNIEEFFDRVVKNKFPIFNKELDIKKIKTLFDKDSEFQTFQYIFDDTDGINVMYFVLGNEFFPFAEIRFKNGQINKYKLLKNEMGWDYTYTDDVYLHNINLYHKYILKEIEKLYPGTNINFNNYFRNIFQGGIEKYNGGYRNNYSRDGYNRYDERDNYYPRRGGYDGGNFWEKPDPVNQVIKELYRTDKELLTEKIWKEEGKKSRTFVNPHLLPKTSIYFTERYNWNLNGPVFAYVVVIKREINTEFGAGNVVNTNFEYDPVKLYIFRERNKIGEKVIDQRLFDIHINDKKELFKEYLKKLDVAIKEDINTFFDSKKKGGYNRYDDRDNYYPRRGGYRDDYYPRRGGYRDDYYPDSMHGGALGEFRKEINREI